MIGEKEGEAKAMVQHTEGRFNDLWVSLDDMQGKEMADDRLRGSLTDTLNGKLMDEDISA